VVFGVIRLLGVLGPAAIEHEAREKTDKATLGPLKTSFGVFWPLSAQAKAGKSHKSPV